MANNEFKQELVAVVDAYRPNQETADFMQALDIVTVSGPTGVGKNTVMTASGLHNVSGCTTRPERPTDGNNYRFAVTHDEKQQLIEDLRLGNFVQTAIHPTTGEFYGSRRDDYLEGGVNLIDVVPEQYHEFKQHDVFRSVRATYITAPYSSWLNRLAKRNPASSAEYEQRMHEAKHSLRMTLEDKEFYHIFNESIMIAARALRVYAAENIRDERMDKAARRAGYSILHGLAHV